MAQITAQLVKKLRDSTGIGMMDCKKALTQSDGNVDKAIEWLRKKGAIATRCGGNRVATEGLIEAYIHTNSQIGVLVELTCETDFVARCQEFKQLARNIAMQIAAVPVKYIRLDDIPSEVVEYERSIESGKDDIASKPAQIRDKITAARVEKRLKEMTLLEQEYIRESGLTISELIGRSVAVLGENIQVRRFVRFSLGENNS